VSPTLPTPARIGPIAADLLTPGEPVEVFSVFETSFYLLLPHGLICVGGATLGAGPINLELTGGIETNRYPLQAGLDGVVGQGVITFDGDLTLATRAPIWQPPLVPEIDRASVSRGLAHIRAHASKRLPSDGLARLVFAPPARPTPTEAAAAPLIHALRTILPETAANGPPDPRLARHLILLVGLGPGLTPSGDDLIGGLCLAYSALGAIDLRDAIWEIVLPELGDLTNEISAMHLSAAADGLGSAAMHALRDAILAGDAPAIDAALPAATRIGHTSGWDTLAGMVIAFEAWLAATS
jgi:hypothetical protein